MDVALPELAQDLGDVARRALADAGGIDLARRAFADPALRSSVAGPLVERLAWHELDVGADPDALVAAAQVCRMAGAVAFPYPLPNLLAGTGGWLVAAIDGGRAWVDHGDLPGRWVAVDTDGAAWWAEPMSTPRNRMLGPFVERMSLGERLDTTMVAELVIVTVLDAWRVLGALETAHHLALIHVRDRRQFGRALADFQGVQFHVADSAVALRGLRQLARFTAWRVGSLGALALVDALALRAYAIEVARTVLSVSQLLHGAVGFCDEHDLSVVQRSLQSSLRLPTDLARTNELLASAIDDHGFDGLFERVPAPVGGRRGHQ